MDIDLVRAVITLVSFIVFLAIVAWAWSSRRKDRFEEAANLPFADERMQAATLAAERGGQRGGTDQADESCDEPTSEPTTGSSTGSSTGQRSLR